MTRGEDCKEERRWLSRSHGQERWKYGWRLDEVIRDYQLLRVVILDYLSRRLGRELATEEVLSVGMFLDDAIKDAVQTYVSYQETHLSESEDRSRGTFENAAVGIAHVDSDGNWLRINTRLCDLLGYQRNELQKTRLQECVHVEDQANLTSHFHSIDGGAEEKFTCELRFVCRDGRAVWTQLTGSLLQDVQGNSLYYILVVEDITERLRLTLELERAKVAAEEGNRLKSEFVANVSHEIRTPMNVILGMIELALDEKLSAETRDYLTTAHISAKSLLTLVNDILDFSKIEAGRLELESIPFNVGECLEETARAGRAGLGKRPRTVGRYF